MVGVRAFVLAILHSFRLKQMWSVPIYPGDHGPQSQWFSGQAGHLYLFFVTSPYLFVPSPFSLSVDTILEVQISPIYAGLLTLSPLFYIEV